MKNNLFNLRVYGLMVDNENQVLVSDEYIKGKNITKFPGGGMEFGEGTHDCLKREFLEELGIEIKILSHFYTTDFFQPSFYHPGQQVISIYYLVEIPAGSTIPVSKKSYDFFKVTEGAQSFRLLSIKETLQNDFTFPIDQKVLELLKKHYFLT